jgi:hypothetical protein
VLAPEADIHALVFSQDLPELVFSRSGVVAQFPSALIGFGLVMFHVPLLTSPIYEIQMGEECVDFEF